ncbi:peptide deformylase [Rhodococcus sp. Eu-32]|uniref:peptide deformylase n=1 Tax=unclassified Rhodococcus (in: high G+C Gram-positive bacteria) TaxID=192944 RepID=UPI000DF27589|nr:peptide deformylase [Rhodococcus sp. Eu-32]NIL74507.1 Peptide deformylase [Rhodococcus sp. B10]RRQ27620.1 peptide deformylase [Rhodococcus sp. Eu-32]
MTIEESVEGIVRRVLSSARDGVVPIVAVGDPVLRVPASAYTGQLEARTLGRVIDVMRETMRDAPGVGLAAPQIGVPLRIAVIEDEYDVAPEVAAVRERTPVPFRVVVNPTYAEIGPARRSFYEGCLSVPGYQAVVSRAADVRLECTDHDGREVVETLHGWPARIVAHETDHLDGVVYLDKAVTRSIAATDVYVDRWADASPHRAADALGFALDE